MSRVALSIPVPVMALLAMWWDRTAHDVASNPTPGERLLAVVIWCGALGLSVAAPIALSFVWKGKTKAISLISVLAVGVSAGVYMAGVFLWRWPRPPELFNSDLEVMGVAYLLSAIAFSLAVSETIYAFRLSSRGRAIGGVGVALVCGCVALVSSYGVVFLE